MVPVNDHTPGHPRLAQLSTSNSISSLQNSPSTSRSTRNLGAIGGRSGPGYSPYARRVSRAAAAREEEEEFEDDATIRGEGESEVGDSPVQQRSGLFGRVKSLPGKALGWLARSSSSKTLANSTSLADVRAAVEEEQAKEQGNGIGRGMQRSKTATNLARAADSPSAAPSALPSRLRRQPQKDSLPSSSSMSALSSIASPFAPSGLRSSHSTLNLASASTNGSGVPSFLTTSNLSRHSRAVSPALSSASYAHSRRSPSPMRNGLAGSMSAFNLAQPRSPTSAFGGAHDTTTLGNAAMTSGSNPFGLTSRSPFAPGGGGGRSGSQRAVSVAGSVRSSSTRPEGHALFPYTSTIPRGASPSIAGSQSMREGLSSFASAPSPHPTSAPSTAQKRPYARVGSPLNPRVPFSPTEGEGSQTGGAERARKKQMVWDPSRGLVSRERLDMEKERYVKRIIRGSEQFIDLFSRLTEMRLLCRRMKLNVFSKCWREWVAHRLVKPREVLLEYVALHCSPKTSNLVLIMSFQIVKEDQRTGSCISRRQFSTRSIIQRTFRSPLRCSTCSLKHCCLLRERSSVRPSSTGRSSSSTRATRTGGERKGTKGEGRTGSKKG